MGSVPVASPAPKGRPRAGRRLLAVAVLAVAVAGIVAAAYVFARPTGFEQPAAVWYNAGAVDEIPVNEPVRITEQRFWLVKLESGEVLALYQRDPHQGCTVPWNSGFELRSKQGWFRNPCHGQTYDLTGRCFDGPCIRGMDRYPVRIERGRVEVNVAAEPLEGPPVDPGAEPVTP
jgi:nitrite reductase/ring-hydroxylating ferredoxin subunit